MAMRESRFSRNTFITCRALTSAANTCEQTDAGDHTLRHVDRKVPSIPLTSMAFTSMRVKRKGTFSGYLPRTGRSARCR
jgi:hypothetical protein